MSSDNRPGETPDAEFVLEADHLGKVYSPHTEAETTALRDVSFEIKRGEFVSIVGPSGSGKSTLLNLIGALDRATSGTVKIEGVDISRLPSADLARIRNEKIGFVFQSYNLIQRISALENVEVPLLVTNLPRQKMRERAMLMLKKLGIAEKANKKPTQLSGGEQQRVAVARALATDPTIVLADEPTGNLDTKNSEVVMDILSELNEHDGKTIVVITHSMEVASRTRKIIYVRDGTIEGIKST
jgi:putative ABC transport system ATP-binding protein